MISRSKLRVLGALFTLAWITYAFAAFGQENGKAAHAQEEARLIFQIINGGLLLLVAVLGWSLRRNIISFEKQLDNLTLTIHTASGTSQAHSTELGKLYDWRIQMEDWKRSFHDSIKESRRRTSSLSERMAAVEARCGINHPSSEGEDG